MDSTVSEAKSTVDTVRHSLYRARSVLFPVLSNNYVMISLTLLPVFALFFFINVLPIGWAVWASLHDIPMLSPEWEWVGIENYLNVLADGAFWASLERSVVFATSSVLIQVVFGTAFALVINQSFRYSRGVRALVLLPYLIPTTVVGFIALWIGNTQWGILNLVLTDYGIVPEPIPWFGSIDLAMVSVVVTNSWKFTIFVSIMVLARLQTINEGFYEAATIAGANAYQKFRDITLPNIKGVLLLVLLLRGIWMFNKFDIIFVTTRGGPGDQTTTAPIHAFEVAFTTTQLGEAAAVSVLLFLVLVAGAIVYFVGLNPAEEVRVE
jgi:multiple sugar transport system permease protein